MMRRIISFILAFALTAGGGVWLVFQLLGYLAGERFFFMLVMAACLMLGVGGYWLWCDFYGPTRNAEG
jgi:hypothetical protein